MKAIIIVGPPGAGKTTYAATFPDDNVVVITRDIIRYQIFQQYGPLTEEQELNVDQRIDNIVGTAALNHQNIIADNANLLPVHRQAWIRQLRNYGYIWIEAHVLNTPLFLCQQRNQQREVVVPEQFLLNAFKRFTTNQPTLSEGFDCIRFVSNCILPGL